MTGAYMRIERNGRFHNIEIEHLTPEERRRALAGRGFEELMRWIDALSSKLAMNTIDEHAKAIAELALPRIQKMSERTSSHADLSLSIWADGSINWSAYTARDGHGNTLAASSEAAFATAEARIQDTPEQLAAKAAKLEAEAAQLRARANRQSPIANPQAAS